MEIGEIEKAIAEYCGKRPEIVACYLFGSYAKGKERQGSDLDVAFLLATSVPQKEYFDLRLTYCSGLGSVLRLDIHPLIMNDGGEVVLDQVFRKGIAVFGGDTLECVRFRMTRAAMIVDFTPQRERMEEAIFRKYKEGHSHG